MSNYIELSWFVWSNDKITNSGRKIFAAAPRIFVIALIERLKEEILSGEPEGSEIQFVIERL